MHTHNTIPGSIHLDLLIPHLSSSSPPLSQVPKHVRTQASPPMPNKGGGGTSQLHRPGGTHEPAHESAAEASDGDAASSAGKAAGHRGDQGAPSPVLPCLAQQCRLRCSCCRQQPDRRSHLICIQRCVPDYLPDTLLCAHTARSAMLAIRHVPLLPRQCLPYNPHLQHITGARAGDFILQGEERLHPTEHVVTNS